jgi:predicted metallopeptidase
MFKLLRIKQLAAGLNLTYIQNTMYCGYSDRVNSATYGKILGIDKINNLVFIESFTTGQIVAVDYYTVEILPAKIQNNLVDNYR